MLIYLANELLPQITGLSSLVFNQFSIKFKKFAVYFIQSNLYFNKINKLYIFI